MKIDISEKPAAGRIAETISPLTLIGEWDIKVVRADGTIERKRVSNVVTRVGLNRIANRAVQASGTTPFHQIVVGTQTAASSIDSVQAGIGEVLRRTSAALGANAQSREWIFLQCTIGGASESVTSVALDSAGIADFPNSHATSGIFGNFVNGLGVTLANSDLLDLTVRLRVGSHNGAHTT